MTETAVRQVRDSYVRKCEAWEGTIFFSYDDAISPPRPAKPGDKIHGTLTIFAGHTGTDVYIGRVGTQAEADAALLNDLRHSEANVSRVVKVALDDGQYEALVDFDFNAGDGALNNSTVLKLVNVGNFNAVPAALMQWDHTRINGVMVESPGLKKRCANRVALWLDTTPSSGQVIGTAPVHPAAVPTSAATAVVVGAGGAVASGVPWPYVVGAVVVLGVIAFVGYRIFKRGK